MGDDLKLPQVGELTLPRWQYWLARYNEVLGERERRIEKLEVALFHVRQNTYDEPLNEYVDKILNGATND